jgi:hypothetical protein
VISRFFANRQGKPFWYHSRTWNGIGAARSSKNTLRVPGTGVFERRWFGEVEGPFPATWSLERRTVIRWILPKVERRLSSVRGVVVISRTNTRLLNEHADSNECNHDFSLTICGNVCEAQMAACQEEFSRHPSTTHRLPCAERRGSGQRRPAPRANPAGPSMTRQVRAA